MSISHTVGQTWNALTSTYEGGARVETHVGLVVAVYSRDYRAMSDVYTLATFATVWNPVEAHLDEVLVNANFECDTRGGSATVDASLEILAEVDAFNRRRDEAKRISDDLARQVRNDEERNRPVLGKKMVVVSGRKVPIGTQGTVAYVRGDGVLLKNDREWRDRTSSGVWVNARHLKAG